MTYNWVQTFWNSLADMQAKNWIDICLTFAIALFAFFQWSISVKKRKDDLFKIRWEFYVEIIKFIRNIDLPLDKLLCSYYYDITKPKDSKGVEIIKDHQLILLKLLLTLYDVLVSNKEILIRYKNLYSNYLDPKMFFLKRKSLCLFDEDISKSLEQFLKTENIIKAFQEHYEVLMKNRNIEIKDLKHYIQRHGWTTNHNQRGSKNKIGNVKFNPDPSEMNIYDFMSYVLMMGDPKLSVPKFTFNKNCMLPKELEKKIDEYLKLK